MRCPATQREINAVDALAKIRAILSAAMFLTYDDQEKDV